MSVFVIVFMIVSLVFAISSLGYVAVDVIVEIQEKKKSKIAAPEDPNPVITVIKEADETEEIMPEIVEHIDAEEADTLISDALAMRGISREKGAGHGKGNIINIGVINDHFHPNETVTALALKEKGLIRGDVNRIKVLAGGMLDKPLKVKAENFSVQAVKMILLTGGEVVVLID